jgi:hypothetical protein
LSLHSPSAFCVGPNILLSILLSNTNNGHYVQRKKFTVLRLCRFVGGQGDGSLRQHAIGNVVFLSKSASLQRLEGGNPPFPTPEINCISLFHSTSCTYIHFKTLIHVNI